MDILHIYFYYDSTIREKKLRDIYIKLKWHVGQIIIFVINRNNELLRRK